MLLVIFVCQSLDGLGPGNAILIKPGMRLVFSDRFCCQHAKNAIGDIIQIRQVNKHGLDRGDILSRRTAAVQGAVRIEGILLISAALEAGPPPDPGGVVGSRGRHSPGAVAVVGKRKRFRSLGMAHAAFIDRIAVICTGGSNSAVGIKPLMGELGDLHIFILPAYFTLACRISAHLAGGRRDHAYVNILVVAVFFRQSHFRLADRAGVVPLSLRLACGKDNIVIRLPVMVAYGSRNGEGTATDRTGNRDLPWRGACGFDIIRLNIVMPQRIGIFIGDIVAGLAFQLVIAVIGTCRITKIDLQIVMNPILVKIAACSGYRKRRQTKKG